MKKLNSINKENFEEETKIIQSNDLKQYTLIKNKWENIDEIPKHSKEIIEKYIEKNNLNYIIDEDIPQIIKGYKNKEKKLLGKRINILPNGKKLARGKFHIYAKKIKINNSKNKSNWAIMYENSSGSKTYLYDEENIHLEHKRKTKIVNKFIKFYPIIMEKLEKDIKNKKDIEYLALYFLIKTRIRVGNYYYYELNKHKGLSTLQKKDININKNSIEFNFIGKDGIPQNIKKEFPSTIIKILKKHIINKKENDFIFTDIKGKPLHSEIFSKILFEYTNEHFYPHIIRSFYADSEIKNFLKKHKQLNKKEIIEKFKEIATQLGHKKWNKKKEIWEADYKVTISNYIRPEYIEEIKSKTVS